MATVVQACRRGLFPFTQKYHKVDPELENTELSQALRKSCEDSGDANGTSGIGFQALVNVSGLVERMYQSSSDKTQTPRFAVDSALLNPTHRALFRHVCDARFERDRDICTFAVHVVDEIDFERASKLSKHSEIWFLDHAGNWLSRQPLVGHPLCEIGRLAATGLQLVHIRHSGNSLVWVFERRGDRVSPAKYQKFIDYLLFSRGQIEPCFLPRPLPCSGFAMPANATVALDSATVRLLAHQRVEPLLDGRQVARNVRHLARKAHVADSLAEYLETAVETPIDRYPDWGRYLSRLYLDAAELSVPQLARAINLCFDRFRLLDYGRLVLIYYLQYTLNLLDPAETPTVRDCTPCDGRRELCRSLNCRYRESGDEPSQIVLLRSGQPPSSPAEAWRRVAVGGFLLLHGEPQLAERDVTGIEGRDDAGHHRYLQSEQAGLDRVTDRYFVVQRL